MIAIYIFYTQREAENEIIHVHVIAIIQETHIRLPRYGNSNHKLWVNNTLHLNKNIRTLPDI